MSYTDELYKYYMEATAEEAEKKPTEVKVPASARTVFCWRDPRRAMHVDVTLEVRATKARWFVWRFGAWTVKTESEAREIIAWGEAEKNRRLSEMARAYKVREYLDRLRAIRLRKQAKADKAALLAAIEEAALRMTIRAKTLDERMAIEDEKKRLEEEIYEAFHSVEDDDDFETYKYEAPELPEAWRIMAANPDKSQFSLRI